MAATKEEKEQEISTNSSQYPFYKSYYYLTREHFETLTSRFHAEIETQIPKIFQRQSKWIMPFYQKGFYIFFRENWLQNEEINYMTDYFTEEWRIQAKFHGSQQSPLEYFEKKQKQKKSISSSSATTTIATLISPLDLREQMFREAKFCNNFRITIALSLIDFFHVESWLDISAGWGDRLIASIARKIQYVGIDPYISLHEGYKKIIDTLSSNNSSSSYTLIADAFEDVSNELFPIQEFDMVGTCPPFFNLEVYSSSPKDSLVRYPTEEAWTKHFLMPSIQKAIRFVKPGKFFVLYLEESVGTSYIEKLKEYLGHSIGMKGPNEETEMMTFIGDLHYYYPENNSRKKKKFRRIHVWQKRK
jgi:hypothetical protein